jgi:benzoyl-CoA reductase/2-hydroxyglutaryl-CoA dehydratase subunit BcrC/BadD/HgdB
VCPLVKSVAGLFRRQDFRRPDLMVVPATCDGKSQLAQLLSPWTEIYLLDLPRDNDYLQHGDLWAERYDRFYRFLQTKFGRRPARQDLLQVCRLANRRTQVFREIFGFRAGRPEAFGVLDYFALASASFFVEPAAWIRQAELMLAEAREKGKAAPPAAGKRILLAGSPIIFPNFKILEVLEQSRCRVAADLLCSAYGRLFDPVVIDEDTEEGLIRALALKHIAASLCPCFLSLGKYLDNLLDLVGTQRLDGVVYHTLRLCQIFELQVGILRQVLKARGIPFLALKTDLGREDLGQLKTRVEAFVEMLP